MRPRHIAQTAAAIPPPPDAVDLAHAEPGQCSRYLWALCIHSCVIYLRLCPTSEGRRCCSGRGLWQRRVAVLLTWLELAEGYRSAS